MRFGGTHRGLVSAVAAFGACGLIARLPLLDGLASACALVGALALGDAFRSSARARHLAAVFVFLAAFALVLRGRHVPPIELAIHTALVMTILRIGTRRGAAHDWQIVILAFASVFLAAALGEGRLVVVGAIGLLATCPPMLAVSHMRREVEGNYALGARDRLGAEVDVPRILRSQRVVGAGFLATIFLVSAPILLVFTLTSAMAPALGGTHFGTGFDGRAELRGHGTIALDRSVVLRFTPLSPSAPLRPYFRGIAFDTFDGTSWSRSLPEARPASLSGARAVGYAIELEADDSEAIFVPSRTTALDGIAVTADRDGNYARLGERRRLSYRAFVAESAGGLAQEDRRRFLQLPADVAPIAALARTLTDGARNDQERAERIARYLRSFTYTLDQPSGSALRPLDDFLFRTHAGHCSYFSTAMTIMLRTVGVPARNVTGFAGGSYNRFARSYFVRRSDAHAWVEVHVPGEGWQTFDPTPSSSAPREESLATQAYDAISRGGPAMRWRAPPPRVLGLLLLLCLPIALLPLRSRFGERAPKRNRPDVATELWLELERALRARGIIRPAQVPPLRFAEGLAATRADALSAEVLALTTRYAAARFGHAPLSRDERADFAARIRTLTRG